MPQSLRIARNAERQIRRASDWWDQNRPSARSLFRQELRRAFELILSQPSSGPASFDESARDVRRVLLVRSCYYVYYRLDEAENVVEVLAIWHTSRGDPPNL